MKIDDQGRLDFSRKALLEKPEGWTPPPKRDKNHGGRDKGIELVNGYYLGGCYHKTCDELGDDWDYSGIEQDLEIFADFLLNLANSADTYPNWYEGNEFKAIRDKSLSQ